MPSVPLSATSTGMRMYRAENVFEAALDRMRWLYREFPNVTVSFSGGKDSTIILQLALIVAKELNRLPVNVFFLDQEAEWQCVIDYMRTVMTRPDVRPIWYQVPFQESNATSGIEHWLNVWGEGETWMRDKEPYAITENRTGETRFKMMFPGMLWEQFGDEPACNIGGVRCEESPSRRLALTTQPTYKSVTWGKHDPPVKTRPHYIFYPIYDWSLSDVWHAISSNGWDYCKLYDLMYQYGIADSKMRVSNVHHEQAVSTLFFLQEIEPDTWQRLTQRLQGVDMAGHMGFDDYFVKKLPPMFGSWPEYRDYLLEHLITKPEWQVKFARKFTLMDARYPVDGVAMTAHEQHIMHIVQVKSILTNDWEFVKIDDWDTGQSMKAKTRKRGVWPS